ncbi:MAG TPA: class I SAM-dependent methyltransferase [Chthoniobacterales bacterium]|nr:class I SAM-dependent methyltransferase [Chthoniobacterales bacterium]
MRLTTPATAARDRATFAPPAVKRDGNLRMEAAWIDPALLRTFDAEGTDAHRLCTIADGWVERFGSDTLISFKNIATRDRLFCELNFWGTIVGFSLGRVFGRLLPKRHEQREKPRLISGGRKANLQTTVRERHLKFGIDFGAGYSVGLFVDQRENRTYVRKVKPKRLLNCFAYTCSFSVAAASVGASTVNVDLSKKSLGRGRANFALNRLATIGHQFIVDDVISILPRLARRGEKFDAIILDPPTFSRNWRGNSFQVENDFEKLLARALEVAARDAHILLSTNCSALGQHALERMARHSLKLSRRAGKFARPAPLPDFPPGAGAESVWLSLR